MVLHGAYFSVEFYCLGSQHEGLSKNKNKKWALVGIQNYL